MENVLIIGYFFRKNFGDDLFVDIYRTLFTRPELATYSVDFVSIDDLIGHKTHYTKHVDVILVAGGDVLNTYFLNSLIQFINKIKFQGPIYGLSVGMPWTNVIYEDQCKIFSYLAIRSKSEHTMLTRAYTANSITYLPDISIFTPSLTSSVPTRPNSEGSSSKKRVGIFLNRDVYKNNLNYNKVITGLSSFLDTLTEYELHFIPFCTDPINPNKQDALINRDVAQQMKTQTHVVLHKTEKSIQEMWDLYNTLDFAICMRYHAHMLAALVKIPIMSIQTTTKTKYLMADMQLQDYIYALPLNQSFNPIDFDANVAKTIFDKVVANKNHIIAAFEEYNKPHYTKIYIDTLVKLLQEKPKNKLKNSISNPQTHVADTITQVVDAIIGLKDSTPNASHLATRPNSEGVGSTPNPTGFGLSSGLKGPRSTEHNIGYSKDIYDGNMTFCQLYDKVKPESNDKTREEDAKFFAGLASFLLVKIPHSSYHYGLSNKILKSNFNAKNELLWIWKDYHHNILTTPYPKIKINSSIKPLFNAQVVGVGDFRNVHRSGWQYVIDHLMPFDSPQESLIFDNYLDRTFHWSSDVYKHTDIIPFRSSWCGFLHHTTDTTYSEYNIINLFKKQEFLDSLPHCIALFTLSHDLATKVRTQLDKISGTESIIVKAFIHPTQALDIVFDLEKFNNNEQKYLVQIGGWLRSALDIHKLQLRLHPKQQHPFNIEKAVLKGKNMDNLFKPDNLAIEFKAPELNVCYDFKDSVVVPNKFINELIQHINGLYNSVKQIDMLSNEGYDDLLSKNIVFLSLVDASAVNVVIECIVRCTPVLTNRLPALEEILGKQYPFFYSNLEEAGRMATNYELIKKTHSYLVSMNKKKLNINYFIKQFTHTIEELKKNL